MLSLLSVSSALSGSSALSPFLPDCVLPDTCLSETDVPKFLNELLANPESHVITVHETAAARARAIITRTVYTGFDFLNLYFVFASSDLLSSMKNRSFSL